MRIPYALAVHGDEELRAVVRVLKAHKTIQGKNIIAFEEKVAKLFGKRFGVMVNSGSSANLLAIELSALPEGSEIITPLLTFGTTLAPLVQKKLKPVFVDVKPGEYLADLGQVEEAIGPKTKALMIPLLLGNVPDMERLRRIARRHNLLFIEDSCDTLGAAFRGKPTGSYSDISTTSFYGSHIITAGGGGGMILVNNPEWARELKILRGWGRTSGVTESEAIEDRYSVRLGKIPYDAKFLFEKVGYNFLPLELSAAFGLAQLAKLPRFSKIRRKNFNALLSFFTGLDEFFILPRQHPRADTNWLAFPLTIRPEAPFKRFDLVKHLEERGVQTRPLFTGNALMHKAFKGISRRTPFSAYPHTDLITERSLVVGCHHGLEEKHIEYVKEVFSGFLRTV